MVKVHIKEAKTQLLHYTIEPYAGQGTYIEVDEGYLQQLLNIEAHWKGQQEVLMRAQMQQVQVQEKAEGENNDN